jgi:uracil-DNA glycosylase family 4
MRTPLKATRRLVRGVGPLDASIILVGEAPGRDEAWWGEPFVGAAGRLQAEDGWGPVGIRRSDVRIENTIEERPASNRLESLTPKTVAWWQRHLHTRLDAILGRETPHLGRVLVPTGNLALNTLLRAPLPVFGAGHKAGQWRVRPPAGIIWPYRIGQYRGSLLEYKSDSGVVVRMIPTTHPASFLYGNVGYEAWKGDWRRIVSEVQAGCPPVEEGIDRIAESGRQCAAWLKEAVGPIAVDLETAGERLLCAAVAYSEQESLVIPLVDPETQVAVKWGWFWLARILASDLVKVFHNGLFDTFLLRWHRLPVHRWRWDTLAEHHLLDPSDRHTLAYCASRDLRTTFWKEESKETEVGPRGGLKRKTANWEQFLAYCGKDARHTIALHHVYRARLEGAGLLPIYRAHYRRTMWAALDLSLEGFAVDQGERDRLHQVALSELERIRHAMAERAGIPLTTGPRILKSGKASTAKNQPKGGLSNPAILKYFYETLKIKAYMKGGKRTANEVALRRMELRYPKAAPVCQLLLQFRHQEKVAQFTAPTRLDKDGRMRGLYRPLTTTGRLRAQTPPTGVGTNPQNQLRSIRSMFVASQPDHLLLELDLSQAESRLVDGASGDPRALKLARTPPLELDQHRLMASEVLAKAMDEVTKHERDNVGKRGRHATNYGMEGVRFSEVLLVETESQVVLAPEECDEIIQKVMRARPYIAVWQAWVRERIIKARRITNSWGRFLRFSGRVLVKEDYKEGYAWGPQSDVGQLLNQEGWLPVWSKIKQAGMTTRVVHQGHDAFILDGPVEELWELSRLATARLRKEREYPGVKGAWTLSMPVGMKLGRRWGDGMHEWKQSELATFEEFKHVATALRLRAA